MLPPALDINSAVPLFGAFILVRGELLRGAVAGRYNERDDGTVSGCVLLEAGETPDEHLKDKLKRSTLNMSSRLCPRNGWQTYHTKFGSLLLLPSSVLKSVGDLRPE